MPTVLLNYGKPDQIGLTRSPLAKPKILQPGAFPEGTKDRGCDHFHYGGKRVIITRPELIIAARTEDRYPHRARQHQLGVENGACESGRPTFIRTLFG